jgi:LysR family hydrogen peroxide-inducible transcriptional activator
MDLRQLAALTAVAEHGSFSAAARALHTVQSNVSTHVARLERELGATLVDRATGRLTAEGRVVVDRARRVQGELDALAADVASMGDVVAGGARLGVIGTVGRWLVPRLVDVVRRHHPQVRLVIIDATTTSLVPQLLAGHVDLAVVNLPVDAPDHHVEPLFREDRLLVAPLDHPLGRRERVSLTELAEHELLLAAPGTAFREELDRTARDAGIELRAQAEVDGMRLLASLAFQGFGAAVIPAGAAPSYVGGEWRRVSIDGIARRTVGIVGRRRELLSIPARAVRDELVAVVDEQVGQRPGIHPLDADDTAPDPWPAAP